MPLALFYIGFAVLIYGAGIAIGLPMIEDRNP